MKPTRPLTRILLAALVLAVLWWAAASNRDWLLFHLRHDKVARDARTLASALQGTGLDYQELGRVQYGSESLPLWVLRQPATAPDARTVCLLAGVHGNEPAGVQALLALAKRLHGNPQPGLRHVLVPLANPWGWERDLRHNGDNRDVSRQFVAGDSQESRLLRKLFAAERCALFVDLHEDRIHEGFYLLAYAEPALKELARLIRALEVDSQVRHARRGEGGLIAVGQAELADVQQTTAALWARLNGAGHAFIVETFDGLPLEERVAIHLLAIDRLTLLFSPR